MNAKARGFALILIAGGIAVMSKKEWVPPDSAFKYRGIFNAASKKHGIPGRLLERVAFQESRFRADIINGKTKSSAGAVGIMQIVEKWHPSVNPLNVSEAVDYAAGYLASLYARFGSWRDALAAYNWGQGNLARYKKGQIKKMPRETINYVREITNDIWGL